ncbi:MAG: APC family permease [Weeksellaceae bacterium]
MSEIKNGANGKQNHTHVKLGEGFATAICGNDILSSALYVSGIAVMFSGVFAPLVLAVVAGVLFLYKAVYTEVVEALPVNGGAYNCLLNGTSKTVAAVAGVMTILSYIATAVISAKVGVEYLNTVLNFHEFTLTLPLLGHVEFNAIILQTIALLFGFAMLVISGLKDSAKVAFGIFVFHIITLISFLWLGLMYYLEGNSEFAFNLAHTWDIVKAQGGVWNTFYLAFSACLLGVSGFESSANFVEEQKPGVFRKTLRNMLIGVAIFNPLIALVVLNSMPYEAITGAKDFLLADAAKIIGGSWYQYVIVADAFLVLSGAVLTAFVGVSGLVHRMSLDSCLPAFLAKVNDKGSFPRIIIAFFVLCSSILIITGGNLLSLAGVYTISFLGVMSLFAIGNIILKETRTELKRTYNAPLLMVFPAAVATIFGIIGNIRIDPNNLKFFELYFIPSLVLVLVIVYQDYILKALMRMFRNVPAVYNYINRNFSDLIHGKFVVFIHDPSRLHNILDYINRNETGWDIILVHCGDRQTFQEIKEMLPVLKKAGVFSHFTITPVFKKQEFGPKIIDKVAEEFDVRHNRILIGSIHHHHPFGYDELGGVRIVV